MKKIAILLFFAISTMACTTDDVEMNTKVYAVDVYADTPPPTHDPKWGRDKVGVQGD
jgi:hypothetical protein